MKKKNIPINLKKITYNLALIVLTAGASVILGFLSFSGMYALYPLLSLAFTTFALSVAYEGEIYLQNIKGALKKLFKNNYLEHFLAKEYLLEHFSQNTEEECHPFFKDYKAQLLLLKKFEHKTLTTESKKKKKQITQTLNDMELWFAQQLFSTSKQTQSTPSAYALELQKWLAQHGQQEEWKKRRQARASRFNFAKGFSTLAAVFMGFGSTYLLVQAFSVIPLFAAIPFTFWPIIVLPMALIAGIAYGLLTYNTVTDLINNNTVLKWYNKLKKDLKQGLTFRNVFMSITAMFLVGLATALTVCTAGTWWTIATNTRPLFNWMSKMPNFIMGIINPIITGASAIFFNIQNTSESLDMVDNAMLSKTNIFQRTKEVIAKSWKHLRSTENWLQLLNPFRILLKITVTPLRILFFFGHLISIALTSDRMPGIPQIVSALIAILSEGFEDAHYFFDSEDEDEEHETIHQHEMKKTPDFRELLQHRLDNAPHPENNTDIPTAFLHLIAMPIYALSALWDTLTSKLNSNLNTTSTKKILSFNEAWKKQREIEEEEEVVVSSEIQPPSNNWEVEHVVFLIEGQKTKLSQAQTNSKLAKEKIRLLTELQDEVRAKPYTLIDTIDQEKNNPVYNRHRLFALESQTSTQKFIEELPVRVGLKFGQ